MLKTLCYVIVRRERSVPFGNRIYLSKEVAEAALQSSDVCAQEYDIDPRTLVLAFGVTDSQIPSEAILEALGRPVKAPDPYHLSRGIWDALKADERGFREVLTAVGLTEDDFDVREEGVYYRRKGKTPEKDPLPFGSGSTMYRVIHAITSEKCGCGKSATEECGACKTCCEDPEQSCVQGDPQVSPTPAESLGKVEEANSMREALKLDALVQIDQEIDLVCKDIQRCASLPPKKRALATSRLHRMLLALERARHAVAPFEMDESGLTIQGGTGGQEEASGVTFSPGLSEPAPSSVKMTFDLTKSSNPPAPVDERDDRQAAHDEEDRNLAGDSHAVPPGVTILTENGETVVTSELTVKEAWARLDRGECPFHGKGCVSMPPWDGFSCGDPRGFGGSIPHPPHRLKWS